MMVMQEEVLVDRELQQGVEVTEEEPKHPGAKVHQN